MGTMQEAGSTLLMSLRLRIELGRITESNRSTSVRAAGAPNIAAMDQTGKAEDMCSGRSLPHSGCHASR